MCANSDIAFYSFASYICLDFIIKLSVKSNLKMGSTMNKDQDVQVFMTLNKPIFYAGQYVEGMVHINCLNSRSYHELSIIIDGSQSCWWKQRPSAGQANRFHFKAGSKVTYHAEIGFVKFDSGIKKGQYNFPFSILLPSSMPASMSLDKFNYIIYQISAVIPAYDNSSSPQIYKRSLNIRQPPRGNLHSLESTDTCHTLCCGVCCDCGLVTLSLKSEISFLQNGRTFPVKGSINNMNGKIPIGNYKIILRQIVQKVSNNNNKSFSSNDIVLYDAKKSVPMGQIQQFYSEVTIPNNLHGYTAIGNIISRVYYLSLVACESYCIQDPTLSIHSILLTRIVPQPKPEEIRNPPVGWNPITAMPLTFVNLPPYIYSPSALLSQKNQAKGVEINKMVQQMPFQPKQGLYEQKTDFYF